MYFDTHAHLNSDRYKNDDEIDKIVKRAFENNVELIVVNGYDLESSKRAVEIAEKYQGIYATVGIHPGDIDKFNENTIDELSKLAKNDLVVAIGEIGLDYYYDKSQKDEQKTCFIEQLNLAKELGLPVVIHSRDAINDTYEILKDSGNFGVMHCYSSSVEYAKKFIEIGYYISLAGPVTFKNAKVAKEVAKQIALEHLLIETDCPYLTPHPYRGKVNEPSYVSYVASEIATIKEISIDEVCEVTTKNGKHVFGLDKR